VIITAGEENSPKPKYPGEATGDKQRRWRRWRLVSEFAKPCQNLISVDPRATTLTSRSTLWLQIRPGTDAALALGMMNVIIAEKLYDREFVENWTYGFNQLASVSRNIRRSGWPKLHGLRRKILLKPRECLRSTRPVYSDWQFPRTTGQLRPDAESDHLFAGDHRQHRETGSMMSWELPETGLLEDFFSRFRSPRRCRRISWAVRLINWVQPALPMRTL